jgi:ubiquinone/menaquinone biosynthesis C-methylase UbiE
MLSSFARVNGAGAKLSAATTTISKTTTTTTTRAAKLSFSSSSCPSSFYLPRGGGGGGGKGGKGGRRFATNANGTLADDGGNNSVCSGSNGGGGGIDSGRRERGREKEDRAAEKASKDDENDDNDGKNNAWEQFYRNHKTKFFRDRHYLRKSFKRDLMNDVEFAGFVEDATEEEMEEKLRALPKLDILEIGAGVGNALFPLLRANPNLRFSAADVSETAIQQLKMHEDYDEKKIVRAFVVNAGEEGCLGGGREGVERVGGKGQVSIKDESFDVVLMCFFLSALTDEEITNCLMEVRRVLKRGGVALVRDYADEDAKNDLSDYHPGRKVVMEEERDAYRRNDGTLALFFSEKQMMQMFAKVGFQNAANGEEKGEEEDDKRERREEKKEGSAVERVLFTQTNRKKKVEITRAFLEARFVK